MDFIEDPDGDRALQTEVFWYYGRWSHSMLTMFEITIAPGAWASSGRLLVYKVSRLYWLFFIPYVWGVTFAIVRVISAIFLKETLAVAADDKDTAVREREKKKAIYVEHLRKIFRAADQNHGGSINAEEFMDWLACPKMKTWMQVLE